MVFVETKNYEKEVGVGHIETLKEQLTCRTTM